MRSRKEEIDAENTLQNGKRSSRRILSGVATI